MGERRRREEGENQRGGEAREWLRAFPRVVVPRRLDGILGIRARGVRRIIATEGLPEARISLPLSPFPPR